MVPVETSGIAGVLAEQNALLPILVEAMNATNPTSNDSTTTWQLKLLSSSSIQALSNSNEPRASSLDKLVPS